MNRSTMVRRSMRVVIAVVGVWLAAGLGFRGFL